MITNLNAFGNVTLALQASLNYLANAHHIQFNELGQKEGPWNDRFQAFFEALKEGWNHDGYNGTVQSGLDAAFNGTPSNARARAEAIFWEFLQGEAPEDSPKPTKRRLRLGNLRNGGLAKAIDSLKSD